MISPPWSEERADDQEQGAEQREEDGGLDRVLVHSALYNAREGPLRSLSDPVPQPRTQS